LHSFSLSLGAFRTYPPVSVSSTVLISLFSDSFLDEACSSHLPRSRFLPLSTGLLRFPTSLHRNHATAHLGSPFSFPLGTVLTQLEILFMLEPLGFRPNCFSQSFSLLMSTFSLLVALVLSPRNLTDFLFLALQNVLLPHLFLFFRSFQDNHRFGFILSLLYLWRKTPHLVRCYAFLNGWLLPSPPPSCHRDFTSFRT